MMTTNRWWRGFVFCFTIIGIVQLELIESRAVINADGQRDGSTNQESITKGEHDIDRSDQSNISFICEIDGYYPDRADCRLFHMCAFGIDTVGRCGEGAGFNPFKQQCRSMNSDSCEVALRQWYQTRRLEIADLAATWLRANETSAIASPCLQIDLNHPNNMNGSVQSENTCGSIRCPTGIRGRLADPYDCSVYHYCNGTSNISRPFYCEAGFFYSHEIGSCLRAKDVPECQYKCPPSGQRLRFVAPFNCFHYYECIDGQLKEQVCPLYQSYSTYSKNCENSRADMHAPCNKH